MSRKQSGGTPSEIAEQRAIVQAAPGENYSLTSTLLPWGAGAHELTEEQQTQIRQALRDAVAPRTERLFLRQLGRGASISREGSTRPRQREWVRVNVGTITG